MALPSDASRPAGLRRDVHDTRTPLLAHRVAQLNSSLLSVRANASSISSASSSSRQPVSATFGTLSTADIAFFDAVITHLHGGASDFASLKKAYNAVRALPLPSPCNEEKDAFLWDKTLCLLQVRGRDWSSRWDAVRMALGLEPRSTGSGEDATLRSEDASESSEEDVTTGGSADELERWRLQAAHTNIHRNPGHRHAARHPDARQQQSQPSKLQSLAAQARTLSRQAGRSQDGDDGHRPHGQDKGAYVDTASDSSTLAPSATYAMSERQKAIPAQQSVPRKLRQYSGTPPNCSESDSPDLQRPIRAMHPSKEGLTGVEPSNRPRAQPSDTDRSASRGPQERRDTPARTSAQNEVQRRFAAVIARSREERAALAAAEAERVALAEELAHAPATRLAEEHDRRKILRPALDWWRQRFQRLEANAGRVDRAHGQIILSKALRYWVKRRQAKEQALNAAGGVDKVRCLLGAWRVWRKTCALRKEHRKEARVAELKSAWDAVTSKRDHRAKWRAWEEWRSRFLHRFAGRLREEHLVRGAYSMWNLALARSRRLKAVENEMSQTMMRNRLADSLHSWQKRLALRRAEAEASQRLDDRLVRSAFEAWRKQGELNVLATNFLALRVKRGAFKAWQTATSERADQKRRESLADRWRVRRKKRQTISRWQNKYQKLADMQDIASSFLVIREERLQHRVLTQWMLEERLVLVRRVRSSRTVATAFKGWKDRKSHFAALLEPKAEQPGTVELFAGIEASDAAQSR
ncbi:Sfi1 spindle body [Ceraceosorus bombacis]|uniref:Sfi1 spindle body n=1 Tax=Ceraceosorus bombacis TaxID=401625 RepID=A0A0P1BN95_9BASI|nr:Sfi1 spindle body [Ceraceosorus bombacis]